jgi:hypothetical protein
MPPDLFNQKTASSRAGPLKSNLFNQLTEYEKLKNKN